MTGGIFQLTDSVQSMRLRQIIPLFIVDALVHRFILLFVQLHPTLAEVALAWVY